MSTYANDRVLLHPRHLDNENNVGRKPVSHPESELVGKVFF